MSKTVIKSFVNTKLKAIISQEIDLKTDCVHMMNAEDSILEVNSSAEVFNSKGNLIGRFRFADDTYTNWKLTIINDELKVKLGYEEKVYPYKDHESLIKAEFDFFKDYAEKVL